MADRMTIIESFEAVDFHPTTVPEVFVLRFKGSLGGQLCLSLGASEIVALGQHLQGAAVGLIREREDGDAKRAN